MDNTKLAIQWDETPDASIMVSFPDVRHTEEELLAHLPLGEEDIYFEVDELFTKFYSGNTMLGQ